MSREWRTHMVIAYYQAWLLPAAGPEFLNLYPIELQFRDPGPATPLEWRWHAPMGDPDYTESGPPIEGPAAKQTAWAGGLEYAASQQRLT